MNFPFNRLLVVILPLAVFAISYSAMAQDFDREMVRIAEQVTSAADSAGIKSIATADFVDLHGDVSELGRFLAEELSTDLVLGKKKLSIIDRTNLKRILEEHKLTMSGLVDPENAKKLGQFAGVDALIIGTITPLDKNVRVSIKIIATDSAKIVGAARGDIVKNQSIEELLSRYSAVTGSSSLAGTSNTFKSQIFTLTKQVVFSLENVRFTKEQWIAINGTILNKGQTEIIVYAGEPPDGNQKLHVSAVDETGNKFHYKAGEGFSVFDYRGQADRPRHIQYTGQNEYVVIGPNESANVAFYLEVNHADYYHVPHLYDIPKIVDLLIEFRIIADERGGKVIDKTASFRNCAVK